MVLGMEPSRINTSDAAKGEVLVHLTHLRSHDGNHVSLVIRDQRSGETVIDINLTPAEFTDILSSTATRISGAFITPNPQHLGKRMQNTSVDIRTFGGDLETRTETARADYLATGWERVRVDRTNFGRRVVAYRWIDDES